VPVPESDPASVAETAPASVPVPVCALESVTVTVPPSVSVPTSAAVSVTVSVPDSVPVPVSASETFVAAAAPNSSSKLTGYSSVKKIVAIASTVLAAFDLTITA
jgi:hypothetical protein